MFTKGVSTCLFAVIFLSIVSVRCNIADYSTVQESVSAKYSTDSGLEFVDNNEINYFDDVNHHSTINSLIFDEEIESVTTQSPQHTYDSKHNEAFEYKIEDKPDETANISQEWLNFYHQFPHNDYQKPKQQTEGTTQAPEKKEKHIIYYNNKKNNKNKPVDLHQYLETLALYQQEGGKKEELPHGIPKPVEKNEINYSEKKKELIKHIYDPIEKKHHEHDHQQIHYSHHNRKETHHNHNYNEATPQNLYKEGETHHNHHKHEDTHHVHPKQDKIYHNKNNHKDTHQSHHKHSKTHHKHGDSSEEESEKTSSEERTHTDHHHKHHKTASQESAGHVETTTITYKQLPKENEHHHHRGEKGEIEISHPKEHYYIIKSHKPYLIATPEADETHHGDVYHGQEGTIRGEHALPDDKEEVYYDPDEILNILIHQSHSEEVETDRIHRKNSTLLAFQIGKTTLFSLI